MTSFVYDDDKLKALVKGAKKRSKVLKRIDKARAEDPYFKGKSRAAIMRALKSRDLLEGPEVDTVGVTPLWDEGKKEQFKKDYNSFDVSEITRRYELENDTQTRNIAKVFGLDRARKAKAKKTSKVSSKAISSRMLELVEAGILLEENGFDKLHSNLSEEFAGHKFDKRKFRNRIFNLIFVRMSPKQKAMNNALQEIVRMNLKDEEIVEKFRTIYSYVPAEFVEKRMKWHQGLIKNRAKKLMGKNLPGIGRIDIAGEMPDFKIPRTFFDSPFPVVVKNADNWPISILNGANFGLKHAPDIVGNVARKALSEADARKDEAIILVNFLCFDLKKAGGPAKTARAQILGDNINSDLIKDARYRKIVERIITEHPVDEIAYRTTEELINDVLGGWIKVCTKPNNHLEYNGKIYVVIGLNELALIFAVTYWEIRWWTIKKQKELDDEIKVLKRSLAEMKKKLAVAENDKDEENIGELAEKISEADAELVSLEYQRAITTVTNVANQESQRFFEYAYSKVIQKIESAIPNSKVIGEGTGYLNMGEKIIKIYVPSHLRVTDGLLSEFAQNYGPDVLREKNPKAVVICHPWALQCRATGRETDRDGKRKSMKVYVAPVAIDDKYLRSELSSLRSKDHPIMKAVYNQTFNPGVLRLRCSNGVIDAEPISIGALESYKNYPASRITKNTTGSAVLNRGPKYMWHMLISDQHWGGRSKEFFWVKVNGVMMRLSLAEAVFHMMREAGLCEGHNMRIHFIHSPDDPTQSQNVKYRTEPHPQQISYDLIEKITGRFLIDAERKGTKVAFREAAEQIRKISLFQLEKRASDYLLEQLMQMMTRHLGPNIDFFSAVLRRAKSANIIVKGVGEIVLAEYGGHDTRNVGFINIGTGNHFAKTTDFEMIEGPLYAMRLRDLLLGTKEWAGERDFISKHVLAPVYGKTCIGWGVYCVKGCHEYGLEIRSAPTNMAGWGDTLKGHVKKDIQRANFSKIWNKKLPITKVCGDKHFFGGVFTSYATYVMSPAAVHTDAYGEHGFPPNNTGVGFIGVPVDGPDSGPTILKCLPFDVIKDFVEDNPRSFDWVDYLPNPA